MSTRFSDQLFHRQVEESIRKVKKILSTNRNPVHASDVHHHYNDKYALAESLTNVAIASQFNVLDRLGLNDGEGDDDQLVKLCNFVHDKKMEVTLRYEGSRKCTFLEERKTKVESPHEFTATVEEKTKKGFLETVTKSTAVKHKVVKEVTEYIWRIENTYSIYLYGAGDPKRNKVVLQNRTAHTDLLTTGTKAAPYPVSTNSGPFDTSVTWLLQNISTADDKDDDGTNTSQCRFKIDRDADTCKTPRRNEDVQKALECFAFLQGWCEEVKDALLEAESVVRHGRQSAEVDSPSTKPEAKASLRSISSKEVFVPVLPLFEEKNDEQGGAPATVNAAAGERQASSLVQISQTTDSASSPLLSLADIDSFLAEQCRSMDEALAKLDETFPEASESTNLISSLEARLYLLAFHAMEVVTYHCNGIDDIESMLKKQLVQAIGKTISKDDFNEYMTTQMGQVLFKDEYAPTPFSYAVRRPNHSPDGIISIDRTDESGKKHPIVTTACKLSASSLYMPVNAATSVELAGDRYLHGWLNHRFGKSPDDPFTLTARARQFSCFMLVVGKIAGPETFEAQDAIILQNKDEIIIPLLLNQLPSPKEFKDAIVSLSPEQRRFAEAFRAMQLQSSVFGVCCIQIKPQLETLLGLPPDSLTKEVRMTQDLLSLFIDYQIPSDLLSYDGADDLTVAEKVAVVKKHTSNVLDMIDSIKEKDLKEAALKADMAFEMNQAGLPPAPAPVPGMSMGFVGAAPEALNEASRFRGGGGSSAPGRRLMKSARVAAAMAPPPMYAQPMAALMDTGSAPRQEMVQQASMMRADEFALTKMCDDFDMAMDGDTFDTMRHEAVEECDMYEAEELQSVDGGEEASDSKQVTPKVDKSPGASESRAGDASIDFTLIPKQLDVKFEALDKDSALRATTIKPGDSWTKREQENLLAKINEKKIGRDAQKSEKDKAFDLLDALTRSGSLAISCSELHVIVCATHVFDKSIIETCIQDNLNPIEKLESSSIIVASTIFGVPPKMLLKDEKQVARLKKYAPLLICDAGDE